MIPLDYRDSRPIYTQVIDSLRQQIRSGILMPGDRLPSVRELAAELSINPNTIQRSYRELESTGWIVSVPGKGSFVCRKQSDDPQQTQSLLQTFDQTARSLLALGFSSLELISRLTQMRGDEHA